MPRGAVMRHMLQENVALCVGRAGQVVGAEGDWNVVFCSTLIEDFNLFYRGGNVNFPLYLYPDAEKLDLLSELKSSNRVPNLAPELLKALKSAYRRKPAPERIFHYIYAILYTPAYRKKYAEFLKTDFPRIPFTRDYELFKSLAEKGAELVDLHLLKSKKLTKPVSKCEGSGELRVVKVSHDPKHERVWINRDKCFTGVREDIWEYRIGGYQVARKWLKDRKGRKLKSEEVATYTRIVTAIAVTITIQDSLDDLFDAVEESLVEVKL